ncbi:hypothetical protein EON80_12775 [bacterium]|nr:MAG: hypothetical protein EON80_12775 [bacterium]
MAVGFIENPTYDWPHVYGRWIPLDNAETHGFASTIAPSEEANDGVVVETDAYGGVSGYVDLDEDGIIDITIHHLLENFKS